MQDAMLPRNEEIRVTLARERAAQEDIRAARIALSVIIAAVCIALLLWGCFALFADTAHSAAIEGPLSPDWHCVQTCTEAPPAPSTPPADEPKVVKTYTCVVSAYYSPLKGQKRYTTGSYAGDIALNGRGTNGASGRPVFPGMIAAPKHIPFGTKIDIEGMGVHEVADRGGAIKGNRIDVWYGRGDEALDKALKWGMRTTTCRQLG